MSDCLEVLLQLDNLVLSDQGDAVESISSWGDLRPNTKSKPKRGRHEKSSKYTKDCRHCRKLTKTCSYTCKNRLKFRHDKEVDTYMRDYKNIYSSTSNIDPASMMFSYPDFEDGNTEQSVTDDHQEKPNNNKQLPGITSPNNINLQNQSLFVSGQTAEKHSKIPYNKTATISVSKNHNNRQKKIIKTKVVHLPVLSSGCVVSGQRINVSSG